MIGDDRTQTPTRALAIARLLTDLRGTQAVLVQVARPRSMLTAIVGDEPARWPCLHTSLMLAVGRRRVRRW